METTKETSKRQETMIADYLTWKTVSGSGARDFDKGDIISDEWLGECKTHMKQVDRIQFNQLVYKKIAIEAMSKMRKPALFVDYGTQRVKDTYVLISLKYLESMLPHYHIDLALLDKSSSTKQTNITIVSGVLKNHDGCIVRGWGDIGDVVIVSLEIFKTILDGDDIV